MSDPTYELPSEYVAFLTRQATPIYFRSLESNLVRMVVNSNCLYCLNLELDQPRCFPVPDHTNHWASQAVLGEKIWLNRDKLTIPQYHKVKYCVDKPSLGLVHS